MPLTPEIEAVRQALAARERGLRRSLIYVDFFPEPLREYRFGPTVPMIRSDQQEFFVFGDGDGSGVHRQIVDPDGTVHTLWEDDETANARIDFTL